MGRFTDFTSGPSTYSGNDSPYTQNDYTQSINEEEATSLLDDNRFIGDIYDYYGEKDGITFSNSKEAIEHFLSDRRYRNFNTVGVGQDVYDAHNQSDHQVKRLARLQKVYDALPNFTGGVGNTLADVALPMLLDPLNLIGFGSGGAAARAAVAGAKGLTKSQLMRKGITAGALGGAKGEAVAGGIAEGIADIGIQHRNIEIGLQDEFSYGRLLGSTAFGAATGGGAGAAFGAAGAVAPVRNLKFGALNFDDSRAMGDRGGPLNKAKGYQATAEDMSGENLEAIANEMGISVEEAQKLTRSSIGRGQIDAVIRDSETLQDTLRPQPSVKVDPNADGAVDDDQALVPWGENLDDNQILDTLKKQYQDEIQDLLDANQNRPVELQGPPDAEGRLPKGQGQVGNELNRTQVDLQTNKDIINGNKQISKIKWVQEWHKTLRPALEKRRSVLIGKLNEEGAGGADPSPEIKKIDDLIENGDRRHRSITKLGRDLIAKGTPVITEDLDTFIANTVTDAEVNYLESGVTDPVQIENQRAGQALLPDNRDPNASADVNAEIGRTVQGEGFTTEVAGGTVTRDDGTRIAEGAAVEKVTDEAGVASEGDARVEGTRAQKEQRVAELKQRLSRRKGSLEHDKRFAKQELAKAVTPEEIDAANKKIADLDNERRDAKVELKELEEQLAQNLDATNEDVRSQLNKSLTEASDDIDANIEAEIEAEVQAELSEFRERFLSADQALEQELNNFKATKTNVRTLLTQLGYDASKVKEISANMPKGNSSEARAGRLAILKDIMEAYQGRQAFNGMIRIGMRGGQTIPVHLLDDAIVDALITSSIPERLQPHAFQHFQDWKASQMDGIIAMTHFEIDGLANPTELKTAIRSLFGDTSLVDDIEAYIDSGYASEMQNMNPIKYDAKEYVDEQLARLEKQNPNLVGAWNEFQRRALAAFVKSQKVSEGQAKKLFDGVIEQVWDSFARTETFKRVSNHGKSYSVKGLTTKTMTDVSVDENQIVGGDYMGHSINRLGHFTTGNGKPGSGRDITNKEVLRIQSILRSTGEDKDFFDSKTFDTVTTTEGGVKRVYTGGAAAQMIQNKALLQTSKSQAMVVDQIKRDRSIKLAEQRKGTDKYKEYQDVVLIEDTIKGLKRAQGKIQRILNEQEALDVLDTVSETSPQRDKLQTRYEKAEKELDDNRVLLRGILGRLDEDKSAGTALSKKAGINTEVKRFVPILEMDDASLVAEVRELLVPLTKSTVEERNANVVETRRTSTLGRMYDAQAELQPLFAKKYALTQKGPSQDLVDVTKRIDELKKEIGTLTKQLTPAERQRLKDQDMSVAKRNLAQMKMEKRQSQGDDGKPLDLDDDALLDAIEDVTGQRPDMDDVAQLEQVIMNSGLSEDMINSQLAALKQFSMDANIPEAEVKNVAKEIVDNGSKNPVKTNTKPSGAKMNPKLIQIGDRVYDLHNDVKYKSIGKNKAEIFINGKKVGTVQHNNGGKGNFQAQIIKQDGSVVTTSTTKSKNDMYLDMAKMFKRELDEVFDGKDVQLEGVKSQGPMVVTDWHNTNRYGGKKDSPEVTSTDDVVADASPEDVGQTDPTLDIVPSEFDLAEDFVLAIQIVDPKHPKYGKLRLLYQGDNQTLGEVAGKLNKEQYVIGQTNKINQKTGAINKNSTVETQKNFRPLDPEHHYVNLSGTLIKGKDVGVVAKPDNPTGLSPRARVNKSPTLSELDNIALTRDSVSPKLKTKRIENGSMKTVGDLVRFAQDLEDTSWDRIKNMESFDYLVSNLEGAYETINKLVPNGVKLPNETRSNSYKQLKSLISKKSEADIAQILTLFNEIAGSQNRLLASPDSMMPTFEKFTKYGYKPTNLTNKRAKDANSVKVGSEAEMVPDAIQFSHEMAHWAYANMLTSAEKLEFWGIARKYMTQNDGMDIGLLKKKLPGFSTSEVLSPAEFFANQFSLYVMKRQPGATQTLFENVANKIKQLIAKVLKMEEPIDPDLIPLFERILPDPQKATGTVTEGRALVNQFDELMTRLKNIDLEKSGAVGIAAQELHDLRGLQIKLEKALSDNALLIGTDKNTGPLQDVLKEVAAVVYGKYGGQVGSRTHKSGAKRITLLDSYSKGRPAINKNKPQITLPNGKTMHPYYFMNARLARGKMLSASNAIHRIVHDERAMSNAEELKRLIAESRADDMSTIEDQQLAMIDSDFMAMERVIDEDFAVSGLQDVAGSGSLGSSFEIEAGILQNQAYLKVDDPQVESLLIGKANDMIVALDLAIEEYTNVFNRNMRSATGGVKAPAINKAGRIYSAGNSVSKKYQEKAYKRSGNRVKAVVDALRTAGKETDIVFGDMPPIVDAPIRKSPKDMSDTEILNAIREGGVKSDNTKELKQEIYMRRQAQPIVKGFVDMTKAEQESFTNLIKETSALPKKEQVAMLRNRVSEFIEQGKYDDANMVIGLLANTGVTPTKPKASLLGRALDIEFQQGRKPESQNGIPGEAPPAIKEVLSKITHRNKNVEHSSRTMLYRMLNLLGRTARDNLNDNTTFMSVEDLYKLSGTKAIPGVKAAFSEVAPTRGTRFNDMRKDLRRYAIGITEGNADPLDIMHEIGHMVSRTVFKDKDFDNMTEAFRDAIQKGDPAAIEMRNRYRALPPEAGYDDKSIAEEWFVESWAQWMSEKVAKGDLFKTRFKDGTVTDLKQRSYLSQLANDLYDYVAYVLNGLIGRNSVKQMFRQMTYHGDMFTPKRLQNNVKNMVDTYEYPAVSFAMADRYARSVIDNMSPEKRILAREFVGAGPDEDLMDYVVFHGTPAIDVFNRNKNPDVYIHPSNDGMLGPGVYVAKKSTLAEDFGGPDALGVGGGSLARERIIQGIKDERVAGEARKISEAITRYEEMIMEADYDSFGIDNILDDITGGSINKQMDSIHRSKASALEAFANLTGFKTHPGIMPLFVKKKNIMNFSQDKVYTIDTMMPNDMLPFVTNLQLKGVIDPEARTRLVNKLRMDEDFDGELLYSSILEAIDPNNSVLAKETLAKHLQDEGYDGIEGGFSGFDNEQMAIFSANNVKHIDAETFDSDKRGIYYSVLGGDFTEGLGGSALQHMASRDRALDIDDMVGISRALQESGTPDLIQPIKKMLRKEPITPEDADTVKRTSSVLNYFRENSQRLRLGGANWLADFIKPSNGTGLYERHDIDLADKIMPIFNILKTLPDNDSWAKRWARKNAYIIPNIGKLGTLREAAAQPPSHRRILNAIRRGEFEVRKLEPQEQRAARLIIQTFEAERQNLLNKGMPVGDTRKSANEFYVPQQWDTEGIRQNPKAAMDAFTRFFAEERRRPDFEATGNLKNPREVAEDLVNAMMDTSGEVYGDDVIRRAVGDPFFARLIKLDPDQYDYMTDFLVNDLEGLVTQYFDRTTRKIAISDKLGTGGHGYASYITVAERGLEGAKDAIMNSAKRRYKFRQYQSEVDIEQQIVARATATEEVIDQAMSKIEKVLYEEKNPRQSIKNILLNLYDPQDMADTQVKIRVDSIANALVDFKNQQPDARTLNLAESMIDVINKRPITKYSGNELAYKVSRNVKAFNAISLLGFTTLTSLGDVVLPLIRSGNMGAFLKAQAKYMTDPTYRAAAKNIGLSVENLLHDRMVQMAGEGSQKLQNSFFNFTLLTPWTNMQREIAGIHGFEAFKAEIARAKRFQETNQMDSRGYRTAVRFLERYGLTGENATTDFLAEGAPRLSDIRDADVISNKQLRYALLRFTNEAIFTPNPNDIPIWAQTPVGSMLFQLKSFQLMMSRFGKYIYDEARQGNVKPALYLMTAGIAAGYAANISKDYAQSRGGEDQESRAPRERSIRDVTGLGLIAETLGVEEGSMTDEIAGNYFEGLLAIGGLGLFGELLYNSAAQADNGAYGKVRVASAFLGPSVGLADDIFDVAVAGPASLFDDEGKNARRREAVRSVIGRVPVAGGIRGFKENAVDYLAGEAGTGGRKSSPDSFGSKDGFGGKGFGKGGF